MKKAGVASTLLLLCFLAMAAFLFLPMLMDRVAVPQGDVLTYEVDPDVLPKGQDVDMDKLARAIDRRLNPGVHNLAKIRKLDNRRLEVALLRRSDADKQRVVKLLALTGNLEFRILANPRDNKEVIE